MARLAASLPRNLGRLYPGLPQDLSLPSLTLILSSRTKLGIQVLLWSFILTQKGGFFLQFLGNFVKCFSQNIAAFSVPRSIPTLPAHPGIIIPCSSLALLIDTGCSSTHHLWLCPRPLCPGYWKGRSSCSAALVHILVFTIGSLSEFSLFPSPRSELLGCSHTGLDQTCSLHPVLLL